MKISALLLTAPLLSIYNFSTAAPIDPSTISNSSGCGSVAADCTINWSSQIFTNDVAAVQVNRSTGSSWLIRYNLYSPSALTINTIDEFTGNPVNTVTPYNGNVWLEIPDTLSASNNINIFTDQIIPGVTFFPDMNFSMTASDVMNGSAFYSTSGEPDYIVTGDLSLFNGEPLTCIECSLDLNLYLNGLSYSSSTNQFLIESLFLKSGNNPLLTINDYNPFTNTSTTSEFYVSAVPVPAALWLFGSGLFALIGAAKYRKR